MTAPERPDTPAMHIIRRTDGEEIGGEFAFFATDGPDGWDVAENSDHDDDTVYEILACYPIARRKFLCSTLCPLCAGEGEGDGGSMCPSCGGSGEHEPPEAEHLDATPTADTLQRLREARDDLRASGHNVDVDTPTHCPTCTLLAAVDAVLAGDQR